MRFDVCAASATLAFISRRNRENLRLRRSQVGNAVRVEYLCSGHRVKGLAKQLDFAALGDEASCEQVMDETPGRRRARVRQIFGEHLILRVDQHRDILGAEAEAGIKGAADKIVEFLDGFTPLMAGRDTERMEEWEFQHTVLGEQRGTFLAVGGHSKKV